MRNKQIKFGAAISYLSIIVNILAGFFFTPWMINTIGKSDYGLYTLANSLITLFLTDFGLSAATARFISRYHEEGDEQAVNNFTGIIYKFYGVIDLIFFVVLTVLYFFLPSIYVTLTPAELEKLKVVYVIAASFNLVNLPFLTLNGILTAYEKFIQLKAADLIYRLLIVGLTVAALMNGMGLYALVAVNAIAGIAVIIYKYAGIKTTTKVKADFRYKNKSLYREIFGFSVWVAVTALAQRLIFSITPSILGIVASAGAIAVFGVISTAEGYFYTFTTAISGMFMPKITRVCIEEKNSVSDKIMPLMINVGRFQLVLNGLLVIGFAFLGKHFIELWMGAEYMEAYAGILLVVAPGLFFNSLEVANTLMVVKNKVNIQAWIALGCGVLNVALSFVLSMFYSVTGACIAICVSYSVRAIAYGIVHKKIMKLNMWEFIRKCFIRMLPAFAVTAIFGVVLNYLVADAGWMILLLKIVCITVVYVLSVLLLCLGRSERAFIRSKIKSLFGKKNAEKNPVLEAGSGNNNEEENL